MTYRPYQRGVDYNPGTFATLPRIATTAFAQTSGSLVVAYFTALKSGTVSTLRATTAGSGAAATPTLARFGVFSVDGSDNLTLIGSTPNDTSLFSSAWSSYAKNLSTPVALTYGQQYAFGILIVSAAAMPSLNGAYSTDSYYPRRVGGVIAGQSTLPSTVSSGSLSGAEPLYIAGY